MTELPTKVSARSCSHVGTQLLACSGVTVGTTGIAPGFATDILAGAQRLHYSSIWSMPDEAVEDWQPEIASGSPTRRLNRITVEGNPPVQLDFALNGGELPGSTATSARVLNAIPA